jgi:phosphoribosylanthranilate isomerase
MNLKVKVCGMRETYNINGLRQLPVDYIGLIFYEKSPRFLEAQPEDLSFLKAGIKRFGNSIEFIKKVGVFVDAETEFVFSKVKEYSLDYVQLHGNENIFYCEELKKSGIKIIKSFSIDKNFSFSNTKAFQYYCDFFLFDTKGENPGGNGTAFDWSILDKYKGETPFFLSGGINPKMEKKVKSLKHPKLYGVDLNSGFEIKPGFKDIDLIATFINNINHPLTNP